MKQRSGLPRLLLLFALLAMVSHPLGSARSADPIGEWKKTIAAAKIEGRVVAGASPTAVLRKAYKDTFEKKFGIEMELISAPGPRTPARRRPSSTPASVTSIFYMAVREL